MRQLILRIVLIVFVLPDVALPFQNNEAPDVIFYNAQIITVDKQFSIQQAVAISGEKIVAVGTNDQVLRLAESTTKRVDLQRKSVLPGLIDSHVHATAASMHEFDHTIPTMQTIEDVLAYIKSRADILEDGEWITVSQVFVTRLNDQRFPNRKELDQVAPNNPVFFRTGPDAALNSMALERSGIDKDFQFPEGIKGRIELDPVTGELTGIIRSAEKFLKVPATGSKPSETDRTSQLKRLISDYNSVGITSISDRNASDDNILTYRSLKDANELNCRVFLYYGINAADSMDNIQQKIRNAANSPLHAYNDRLWLRGVKVFLDGGMLTGSAYMQKPWGISSIYGINDPEYRGVRYIDPEKLYAISKLALSQDLQMTAHSVGDAAIELLVKTYETIDRDDFSIRDKRPCVTHCNFMSPEVIETMSKLGIVADLQPIWLWLDGKTLRKQFGEERMRYFQPYRTLFEKKVMVGGGSDHMQKIGSLRSVNPYNPFLGMWIAMQRRPRTDSKAIYPEQSLSREQVIRLYTINNAWLSFEETKKGSIEPGKLADLIVLETDILNCPVDEIKDIQVHQTYVGGKLVYPTP
ncbi:MAG: amidohydrolase [Planctomycetota bacterium]|nr:amidohydrolase [Planctomycetota bacterium]